MEGRVKKKLHIPLYAIIALIVLTIYSLVMLLPIFWVLMNSIKDRLAFRASPFGWPKEYLFSNYALAFKELTVTVPNSRTGLRDIKMFEMVGYSLLYSIGGIFVSLTVKCVTAYVVAKYPQYRITKVVYALVIFTMIFPVIGALPSQLYMARTLHIYDNIAGMWIMGGNFLGLNFLILYSAFKGVSWEYAEAAQIDGASHFGIFIRIMLPFISGTLFALGLLAFIGAWNDYTTPMIFLPSYPTIAYGLFSFMRSTSTVASSVTLHFTACMLVMLPTLVLYLVFRNRLIGTMSVGGLKG